MGAIETFYIVCNILAIHMIYRFLETYFPNRVRNQNANIIFYIAYFLISCILCLYIDRYWVVLIINFLGMLSISLGYSITMAERLVSGVKFFIIISVLDILSQWLIIKFESTQFLYYADIEPTLAGIIAKMGAYLAFLLILAIINSKINIPKIYLAYIVIVAVTFPYILYYLSHAENYNVVILVFLLCILPFVMYDTPLINNDDKIIICKQNKYYERQLVLMRDTIRDMISLRHDLKNHLLALSVLIRENDTPDAIDYIDDMLLIFENKAEYSSSGNIIIDSIINFKLLEAHDKGVRVYSDINIPSDLAVKTSDITLIIGNLLDNAVASASKVDGGYISVKMKYSKGRLIIYIENSFDLEEPCKGRGLLAYKRANFNHVVGLDSVRLALKKYNGEMDVIYEDGIASVTAIIFI